MIGVSSITSFFGSKQQQPEGKEATSLDIIMYAVSLASTPQSITSITDQIRKVTAQMAGAVITSEQNNQLKAIYLELEQYLLTNEPAQKFTKESLRERISQKLHLSSTTHTFWTLLEK